MRKIHNRRVLDEAVELGHWPAGAVFIHQPARVRAGPAGNASGGPPTAPRPARDPLPRELRDIHARLAACLEELSAYLIRRRP